MRLFAWLIPALLVVSFATAAVARESLEEIRRRIEAENREVLLQMERARLQSEMLQSQINRQIEGFRQQQLQQDERRRAEEALSIAIGARDQARAAESAAKQLAEEVQEEAWQQRVGRRNYSYILAGLLVAVGFVAIVRRDISKGAQMKNQTADGLLLIVTSVFLMIAAIVLSAGYVENLDLIQNTLSRLRFRFWNEGYDRHMVDVPTKYVLLGLLLALFYGVTTFLGITRIRRSNADV